MIYPALAALLCLSVIDYLVARSVLYPPFLFSVTWLLSLLAMALWGGTYYPVAPEALLVYLAGAICFSIGGFLALAGGSNGIPVSSSSPHRAGRARAALDIALLVAVAGLPFYVLRVAGSVDFLDSYFLATVRGTAVEATASSERSFGVLNNLVLLATFVALAMHYENDGTTGRRWRSALAILVAILYGVLTGSKAWAVIFPTLAFVSSLGGKKVRLSTLALVTGATVVSFGAGLLAINFVYGDVDSPLETVRVLADAMKNYWIGSLVAFNRVVLSPDSIAAVQSLGRFFLETANALGASFAIPSIHADYTQISPTGDFTNTYTIYFSYYKDLGWAGVVVGLSALGAGLSWVYRYASRNHPVAVIVFAAAAVGIILSFHAEHFVLGLNYYAKLVAFCFVVYHVATRRYAWKAPGGRREGPG